ncbi:MAG: Clp protease ClpP, partial [Anaeroplasmataceae bacterium]|nr:Clp protease ClpP [Anaeroplasmataceae bacterium]
MSQTINAVGPVVSNDEAWLYEFLEMEYISPKAFDDAMAIGEDLVININSGGGDVFSGEEIYTKLCMYAQKVTINIVGLAASAASLIAMAGDQVNISTAGQIMIHNVSSIQNGDYHDMEKATDMLKKANVSLANAYAKKTGKSQEE